ncbi:HPP family protein [Rhodococcus sp. NPDC003318]|uniref:HPP family protein n=1 Tax=Rhodococcus sp. NPDC003318 TaxID=3364503 RepID=UPI0036A7C959
MTERRPVPLRSTLRSLGPAYTALQPREVLRAGTGTAVGLALTGSALAVLVLIAPGLDPVLGLYMIAPFGATAVLVFAAPSSPLGQPWPAIVGNTLAAVVGVAATLLIPVLTVRIALAVGLSVAVMLLFRAVHPPAGAVAMTAALSPEAVHHLGFRFVLTPVLLGTCLVVAFAAVYGRLTGRHYPLRQLDSSPPPVERLGLSEDELTNILQRYEQSLNLGVADLARLVGAAELQAAGHRTGPLNAGDVMSRDLVTIGADATLDHVADLFRKHGFTSLPVVDENGKYSGVVFQIHLILCQQDSSAMGTTPLQRRGSEHAAPGIRAGDIMAVDTAATTIDTPVGALLPLLAEGGCDAVPVLEDGVIVGIVTQTDLIAALARQSLRADTQPI